MQSRVNRELSAVGLRWYIKVAVLRRFNILHHHLQHPHPCLSIYLLLSTSKLSFQSILLLLLSIYSQYAVFHDPRRFRRHCSTSYGRALFRGRPGLGSPWHCKWADPEWWILALGDLADVCLNLVRLCREFQHLRCI